MSNLLVGIIGVALFIGLALGAAIFIGPQFDEAQTNAQASDTVQAVAQVAASVNSYRLATGYSKGPALSTVQDLVDAGFLQDVPANTAELSLRPQIVNSLGQDIAVVTNPATFVPKYVVMSLRTNQELCTLIERKLGSIDSDTIVAAATRRIDTLPIHQIGCFRTSVVATDILKGDYLVYARF